MGVCRDEEAVAGVEPQRDELIHDLSLELDGRTQAFVSDRATQIEHFTAQQARIEGEIKRFHDYLGLLHRHQQQLESPLCQDLGRQDLN